jgi:tetraacyldisaccharide 4'-kinase
MAKRRLEDLERFAIDVILHGRGGKRAALLRALLRVLSQLFTAIVRLRVHLYRTGHFKSSFPGCTVISIGNLTVGGTGKTPVVELFARTLRDNGRRVAILSRGYKSRKPPVLRRWQNRW